MAKKFPLVFKYPVIVFFASFLFLIVQTAGAQEGLETAPKVEYGGEVVVDSDLDGLTDKGEQQLYGTDPGNPDTDGDGFLDGAEIMNSTDPSDAEDPGSAAAKSIGEVLGGETPWVWYLARTSGILAFIFLWLTVFFGLAIRNPLLKGIIRPIYSFDFHCFLAAVSVFWALVHGTSLLFDVKAALSVKDVAIPFFSKTALVDVNYLALGIMAFYMMVVLTTTSYLKKRLNHKLWRALHFLNPVAFLFVVLHGYTNGTDMKNFYAGSAFLFFSFLLVLLYVSSLMSVIIGKLRKAPVRNDNISSGPYGN